jgi:hypothetical protein
MRRGTGIRSVRVIVAVALGLLAGLSITTSALAQPATRIERQLPDGLVERRRELSREDVRNLTRKVLERYPPSLGQVLRLDPTLLQNDAYLSPYSELKSFLAQYPEVARSPEYYLDFVWTPQPATQVSDSEMQWNYVRNMTDAVGVGLLMAGVAFVLLWLIRHFLAHRRWVRSSRLQMEIHNRLMERLQNGDDVKKYLESASAARVLADDPTLAPTSSGAFGSPVGRILLAVQVGLVLACTGIGVLMVKRLVFATGAASDTLVFFGVIGLAIGVGFALSAGASFIISRRFGLLPEPPAPQSPDRP